MSLRKRPDSHKLVATVRPQEQGAIQTKGALYPSLEGLRRCPDLVNWLRHRVVGVIEDLDDLLARGFCVLVREDIESPMREFVPLVALVCTNIDQAIRVDSPGPDFVVKAVTTLDDLLLSTGVRV